MKPEYILPIVMLVAGGWVLGDILTYDIRKLLSNKRRGG